MLRAARPALLLCLGLLAQLGFGVAQAWPACVETDEADYAPSATARIYGHAFRTGEKVRLQVLHTDGTPNGGRGHQPWIVVADKAGSFQTDWFVAPDDSLGSAFRLSAIGLSSGLAAENAFTDASTSKTILSANPNPSVSGETVTLTATVSCKTGCGGSPPVPTGTVTFTDGATSLGTAVLNGGGVATLNIATFAVGSHALTAAYNGDGNYPGSTSGGISQVVNKANVSLGATSPLTSSIFGQSVSFTATVTATAPGVGTPTGTVQFTIDGANFGSPVILVSGTASSSATSTLNGGTHTVTAVYSGDNNFNSSTSLNLTQTVNNADTSTSLGSSLNPSVYSQATVLTATAVVTSPGAGTASGTITFKDGATSLGTATLDGSGVASLSVSSLTAGSHSLTAAYGGDTNRNGSTSSTVSQTVKGERMGVSITWQGTGKTWRYKLEGHLICVEGRPLKESEKDDFFVFGAPMKQKELVTKSDQPRAGI